MVTFLVNHSSCLLCWVVSFPVVRPFPGSTVLHVDTLPIVKLVVMVVGLAT
jgi:hypothetical protein